MPLLELVSGSDQTLVDVNQAWSQPGLSAEDAGFEPARAVNPTRVPGERHRPLGESSVGHGSQAQVRVFGQSNLCRVLDSRWTPRGVYPVNSPRAGRQQGSMGSGGCAGSPI